MKFLVLKAIRMKKGNTLTEVKPGQAVEVSDSRKAESLIRDGYLQPVPESPASPIFREQFVRLVSDLDQAWPALLQEQKDRIFALVDDLDEVWLSEDREGFDRIISKIREAASSMEDVQPRLFELAVGGGDPS